MDGGNALAGKIDIFRRHFPEDLVYDRLALLRGFFIKLFDEFESEPTVVSLAIGDDDMIGEKQRIFCRDPEAFEIRVLDELGCGFFTLSPELVRDLLLPALLFKKFAFRFGRTSIDIRCSMRILED